MERWLPIKGFEKYFISSEGRVKSFARSKTGIILTPWKTPCKVGYYFSISLGRKNKFLVHRLVAEMFLSREEGKNYVNHKDGNKTNNKVENLEWVTMSENNTHAYRNNLKSASYKGKIGEDSFNSSLSNDDAQQIRELYKNGLNKTELSKKFNVSWDTINRIVLNRTYKKELTDGSKEF